MEKSKEQLLRELETLRQRITELEQLETGHQQTEQALLESEIVRLETILCHACIVETTGIASRYIRLIDKNAVARPCAECSGQVEKIQYLGGTCYFYPNCQDEWLYQ